MILDKLSIDAKLNSYDYKYALENALSSMLNDMMGATTEASVASIFENELYYLIRSEFNVKVSFQKEIGKNQLRHRFTGRMDAVSNDLVIEYKKRGKLDSKKDCEIAVEQVNDYLNQLFSQTGGVKYHAILTDGEKICYFYYINNTPYATAFRNIGLDDLDRIVKLLLNVGNKQFVPFNIVQDFRLNSSTSVTKRLSLSLFNIIKSNISEKTEMLFKEWEVLFHLSESDKGQNLDIAKRRKALEKIFGIKISDATLDYKCLFVLQTTYAIIVKLIACKVISKLAFNKDIEYFSDLTQVSTSDLREFIEVLEDGYIFTAGGIRNLLEGDFFSWYCAENQWTEDEAENILEIIKILDNYSTSIFIQGQIAIDIFKDLYMEIMPNEVRHSLGEYFTPAWLANYVVTQSIEKVGKNNWNAIDPCCGSGVFVVSLIKEVINNYYGSENAIDLDLLSEYDKEQLLNEILSRVQGIDINPLSVLTARVSYLLTIFPLIGTNSIEIPIYLGDSANIPEKVILDGVNCYKYTICTLQGNIDVIFPCGFVNSNKFLSVMNLLQSFIKAENSDTVFNKIVENIDKRYLNENIKQSLKLLSDKLVYLHKQKWDGIWIRIVANFMLVAKISNVDIIVGNPPWVKWEFLPQHYANKIKSLCVSKNLFSGQTYMGAISLNICALISNVTASHWLNDGGVLAFLMPKTLMTQDSYAGFRNFYLNPDDNLRLYLQSVDDWTNAGNPFVYTTEKFMTYYYQHKFVDYSTGVPIHYIVKKRGKPTITEINESSEFEDVSDYFTYHSGKAYQFDKDRTGFTLTDDTDNVDVYDLNSIVGVCDYKARSGVEFTPADVYFISPDRDIKNKVTYLFKTTKLRNAVHKSNKPSMFELETTYVRPVIKSPCIEKYHIKESDNYCIFPYDEGCTESTNLDTLMKNSELLAAYLLQHKDLIGKQSNRSKTLAKGTEFYSLSKIGKYTYAKYAVVFRDNTNLVASVIKPVSTPWGSEIMPICAKHSPYISMDKKNRYISEDEAYFICGILNTNIVNQYFKHTFSNRSYSIDFNIKIPMYDNTNSIHTKIVQLSKNAHILHADKEKIATISSEIEKLYLMMCKSLE